MAATFAVLQQQPPRQQVFATDNPGHNLRQRSSVPASSDNRNPSGEHNWAWAVGSASAALAAVAINKRRKQLQAPSSKRAVRCALAQGTTTSRHQGAKKASGKVTRRAMEVQQLVSELSAGADPTALAAALVDSGLLNLLGPPQPAMAAETMTANAANVDLGPLEAAWQAICDFFFDPRLQWDENGNVLLDPKGDPLPDNLWTQFVACQATLMKRLTEGLISLGVPQPFGWAVVCYTLGVRAVLYPFVKSQMETTAKMQVLNPRVKELKEKYKDDETRLNQEVGMLFMDLQVDPLQAIVPLLLQLPVFWGLYRGIRRLAIVEYEPLQEGFLWIPSLYGPGFSPDPSLDWILNWQGPLIELHPKIGWETFGLYALLPVAIFIAYKQVLSQATEDKDAPKILEFFPYMLGFITVELPQAMGLYIGTNIASSVALTQYTKASLAAKIPGYDEFVETGKWPPGVDPEKVLAKAFEVKRLSSDGTDMDDPKTVPEAIFLGRADAVKTLIGEEGRDIDEFDDRGIPASAYSIALDNPELLQRLFDLGSDPCKTDKKGNTLLHYAAGYGRSKFLEMLFEAGLDKVKNETNDEGQTALDVARANLQQEKVADAVRDLIPELEKRGCEGVVTTKEDEEKMEKVREDRIKEKELQSARSALMALAKGAQEKAKADIEAEEADKPKEEAPAPSMMQALPINIGKDPEQKKKEEKEVKKARGMVESKVAESLERIKQFDVDALRERFGDKLSEEQLAKLAEKVKEMDTEQLMQFAATGEKVKRDSDEEGKDGSDKDSSSADETAEASHKAAADLKAAVEEKKPEAPKKEAPAKEKVSLVVD
mmetsp:Transcript_69197/g.165924  ORF Transcript_69197/g.165924 Transcript_69197/m.165924 type:complete len:829 (+) Transcript_69197:75-2561(+)